MANLTGEYDLVIEVGMGLLNAVLGAVHENQERGFPPMPHSLDLFVDDAARGAADPVPEADRTGIRARIEVQVSTPILSLPIDTLQVRPEVLGAAAPRAAMLSTSGIILPPTRFSSPRVTARFQVRAWVRDPTGGRLPEFVHGDLFVTSAVARSEVAGVGTFLTMDRTNGPLVTFQPAVGTEVTDEQRGAIASIVRNVVRGDMNPPTFKVSLPPEVRHFDFNLQPEARRPSVQLLLTLGDRTPGPGARNSVRAGLLPDGADFAVAVGRDFVLGIVGSNLIGALQESYSFSKFGISATVRPNPPTFDLEPGRIVFSLTGDGDVKVSGIGGLQDHFTFSIRQAFTLRVVDGGLEPVADGDPVVDVVDIAAGEDFVEGKIRDAIKQERDAALAAGASRFREALDVGRQLESILSAIHPAPAGVALTGVEIRPEGILVPGTVALAASSPVVVGQVGRDGFNDALESWIPGGSIDRFVWEPFETRQPSGVRVDEHRFVTEALPGVSIFSGFFCLRVEGTRVAAGGGIVPASGSACFRLAPVVAQIPGLSGQSGRPLFPLAANVAGGGVRVIGHYDPWAHGRAPSSGPTNLLLHFPSAGGEEAAKLLGAALEAARKRDAAVLAVAVVPAGQLRPAGQAPSGDVVMVEDSGGWWAQAFGVEDVPATVLIGPRGEVAWKDGGAMTAAKLARAIDKHAARGGEIARHPIGLAVGLNQRPPDFPIRLPDGSELTLRRLRGRPVVLAFWTPRSEPSLDQLELLREVATTKQGKGEAPLVIAVGDGEGPELCAEIVERRRLPFLVLPDPDRRVSRLFGVWCWPATVWIRADQRVEAIDLGAAGGSPSGYGRG